MSDGESQRPAASSVDEVIARVKASWEELLQALDGIPDERLEEPGVSGEWSVKNLLGHFAFWDEQAAVEIAHALAGEARTDNEWQAMNEADHAQRRSRNLPEERAAMHQAHAMLMERLEEVTGADGPRIDAAVAPGSYQHYEEHTPDIRAWRERSGI